MFDSYLFCLLTLHTNVGQFIQKYLKKSCTISSMQQWKFCLKVKVRFFFYTISVLRSHIKKILKNHFNSEAGESRYAHCTMQKYFFIKILREMIVSITISRVHCTSPFLLLCMYQRKWSESFLQSTHELKYHSSEIREVRLCLMKWPSEMGYSLGENIKQYTKVWQKFEAFLQNISLRKNLLSLRSGLQVLRHTFIYIE